MSIAKLQDHMKRGTFSSSDLTSCYLERIKRLNTRLKAVIETNPDALAIARERDEERNRGRTRGPLHGIPFLVKDNIGTNDKMETTAGSTAMLGARVPEDAVVVSRLREAGAVLLGHANMSEWASIRSSYYSEGYSRRGGQCRSPFNLALHPAGSSSGSAVGVATSMCAFSLGTETDGSVVVPADRNGVVGIKPTLGSTPTQGLIPESHNFDVVGTFGKTVADAALALDTITRDPSKKTDSTTLRSLVTDKSALQGAKFGMPWKGVWKPASEIPEKAHMHNVLMGAIRSLREAGAEVLEHKDFPSADAIISPNGWNWEYPEGQPDKSEFTVIKTDFYNDMKAYLASLRANPNNFRTLDDIVAWNKANPESEGGLPGKHGAWPKGQDTLEACAASQGKEDDTYWSALRYLRRMSRDAGIDAALRHGDDGGELDGLLVPVQADGGAASQLVAKSGYPMITIPLSTNDDGVPFGLAIIHKANREDLLVKYGSAIEDLFRFKPKPEFRNIDADNYMYIGVEPDKG